MSKASKVFQCLKCRVKFSESSFEELKFFPSTGICKACYEEAKEDSSVCFGKSEAYNSKTVLCRSICPDRKVCRLFIRVEKLGGRL